MKIACLQTRPTSDLEGNLEAVSTQIRAAAQGGAQFIATPEATDYITDNQDKTLGCAVEEKYHPFIPKFQELAMETAVPILAGSFKIKLSNGKLANRSYWFSPDGTIAAGYDKIHLYDADPAADERYRESQSTDAGNDLQIVAYGDFHFGLSICYDLRFPYLYRTLTQGGANVLCVPSAFAVPTGAAHWEALLRARAIENGAYVVAPATGGLHDGTRKTYGRSMVIDPWGDIIAALNDDEPAILYAELHQQKIEAARAAIPAWKQTRMLENLKTVKG